MPLFLGVGSCWNPGSLPGHSPNHKPAGWIMHHLKSASPSLSFIALRGSDPNPVGTKPIKQQIDAMVDAPFFLTAWASPETMHLIFFRCGKRQTTCSVDVQGRFRSQDFEEGQIRHAYGLLSARF